jgi:tripartite-type tricarboxylate transporter receptor subunit TctC
MDRREFVLKGALLALVRILNEETPTFMNYLFHGVQHKIFPEGGGMLIRSAEGEVLGAVGVTGDTEERDEELAAGRVRVLAVTTKNRTAFLPEVPAVSETVPGCQFPMWVGLFAPANTPKSIIDRLAKEVRKAMQNPMTRKPYTDVTVEPKGSTREEFDAFFREQLKFNKGIITSANMQQE